MSYKDKIYSKYVSAHISYVHSESKLEEITNQFKIWGAYFGDFLPQDKSSKILEIGCGNGGFVLWLERLGFKNAAGVDVSEEQVKEAERLGIKNVSHGDLRNFLKNKKGEYAAIFARDLIEHFDKESVLEIFEMAHQALTPGGVFVIQTPNGESPMSGRFRYWDFTHETSFTSSSFGQVARTVGFQKISVRPMGPVIHGLKSCIRFFLWKCIEAMLRFYLLVETGSGAGIFTQNLIGAAFK
jgi:2-polyprenyl-3-methyl-5-hydroxy-6-metoxy-1,4-benzoquinol methylase